MGPYTVVGRIGAGGMGAVYAGIDARGRCSAVKVVHSHFAADPDFLARFAREVDLVRRVRATCTAAFHDADTDAETPWLATEYVPGRTLRQHVREKGVFSGGPLLALAVGLAEALMAVHDAGVVHRDLKPGNVIVSPEGPRVLDFGIARATDQTALTRTGGLFGTPGWIAPEQYDGTEASPASDMFAWAGLVAFACTGRTPFGTGDAATLALRTRTGEPDLDGVPESLLPLVRRGLDRDPRRRPSAAEVLDLLTREWKSTRVLPPGGDARIVPTLITTEWGTVTVARTRRTGRSRARILTVACAVVALVLTGAWVLQPGGLLFGPEGGTGEDNAQNPITEGQPVEDGTDQVGEEDVLHVQDSPEDADAVLSQALELALAAESFEAVRRNQGVDAPIMWSTTTTYRYTRVPDPVFHTHRTARGGIDMDWYGVGDQAEEILFSGDPGGLFQRYTGVAPGEVAEVRPEYALEYLDLIVQTGQGPSFSGWEEIEPVFDWSEQTGTSAAHYSGTFTDTVVVIDPELGITDDFTEVSAPFDVWIGEDGHPVRVHYTYVYDTMAQEGHGEPQEVLVEFAYFAFGSEIVVNPPAESEIDPAPPQSSLPG